MVVSGGHSDSSTSSPYFNSKLDSWNPPARAARSRALSSSSPALGGSAAGLICRGFAATVVADGNWLEGTAGFKGWLRVDGMRANNRC